MDLSGVKKFLEVIQQIRDPKTGCPWDLAQSHESLLKYFIEEVHEFNDAMSKMGPQAEGTWEELGDVLLQVGLHAKIAEESNITNFNKICLDAAEKLIDRHPHVFDPDFPRFNSPEEVNKAWEQIKARAKSKKTEIKPEIKAETADIQTKTPKAQELQKIPFGLPSLLRAQRIGEKAASFSFDWPDANAALDKVLEETQELIEAQNEETAAQEEFGDLLFALTQYSRKRQWDSEQLLQQASQKFCDRFEKMEQRILKNGKVWQNLSLEELEEHWQATKALTLYH